MDKKSAPPKGALLLMLAAAAVVVAATAAAVVTAGHIAAVITAAAEEDQQNDDPAPVTTAETIVAHKKYLRKFVAVFAAHSKIFRSRKMVQKRQPPADVIARSEATWQSVTRKRKRILTPAAQAQNDMDDRGCVVCLIISFPGAFAASFCRLRNGRQCN